MSYSKVRTKQITHKNADESYSNTEDVWNTVTDPNTGISHRVIYVNSIDEMNALDTSKLLIGQIISVYGSEFRWNGTSYIPTDYINIRAFGAVGDGTTDDSTAFNDAVTYFNGSEGTLLIPSGSWLLGADVTIPENITLKFLKGGIISTASTKTLTIYSPANINAANNQQIFDGRGGDIVFTADTGYVSVMWFGAKGDGITSDDEAIQAALNVSTDVFVPNGTYLIGNKLDIVLPGTTLYGIRSGWGHTSIQTMFIIPPSFSDWVIECSIQSANIEIRDIYILGNENGDSSGAKNENALGGINLLSPGSINSGNRIIRTHVRGFSKLGAYGIRVESWSTTIRDVHIRSILRGTGLRFGAGGVTGTTQYIERVYIGECDTGVVVKATSIGVTFVSPIIESCTVAYYQYSNNVVMYNSYFENVNRSNYDSNDYKSLVTNKILPNNGDAVDYAIYVDRYSQLSIYGMGYNSLNNNDNSKFLGVGDAAQVTLIGCYFNNALKAKHFFEDDPGGITNINPGPINKYPLERLRSIGSRLSYAGGYSVSTVEIYQGKAISYGDNIENGFTRYLMDEHIDTTDDSRDRHTYFVSYANQDSISTNASETDSTVDVADASDYTTGDYVSLEQDDNTYLYTTIDSIAGNTITLSNALSNDLASGNSFNVWRWGGQSFNKAPDGLVEVLIASGETENVCVFKGDLNHVYELLIITHGNNTVRNITKVYVEVLNGVNLTAHEEEIFNSSNYDITASVTYSGGMFTVAVTNDHDTYSISTSAKLIQAIKVLA